MRFFFFVVYTVVVGLTKLLKNKASDSDHNKKPNSGQFIIKSTGLTQNYINFLDLQSDKIKDRI